MNNKIVGLVVTRHENQTRRDFIRKVAYASPVLLTLPAAPSFAQQGSGSGGSSDPEPPTDGSNTGPRPSGELNCDQPLTPIDSDVAQSMCSFSVDDTTGELLFEDIIVSQDEIPGQLAQGNLMGTCEEFFCNAS